MAIAGEARVIAIARAPAMCSRPDVAPPTRCADNKAAEQEVGCVAPPRRGIVATLAEQALSLGEHLGLNQRSVRGLVLDVPEGDLADVNRVAYDAENADVAPQVTWTRPVPVLRQITRHSAGSQMLPGIEIEDQARDGCLGFVRFEQRGIAVKAIAKGC